MLEFKNTERFFFFWLLFMFVCSSNTLIRESYMAELSPVVHCMHNALDSTVFHRRNTIPFHTSKSYDCIQKYAPYVENNPDTFDLSLPAQICLLDFPLVADAVCIHDTPGTSDPLNQMPMDCDRAHKRKSYRPGIPFFGDRRFDSSLE